MIPKKYSLVVDVETAGGLNNPLVYDIGLVVCDNKGVIYYRNMFIVHEIFYNEPQKMKAAYFACKIPWYQSNIKQGTMRNVSFFAIRTHVTALIKKYNVSAVYAYNAAFDFNALNNTLSYLTQGKETAFFPADMPIYCIWHMACQSICMQKGYATFCIRHGFMSDVGNLRTGAEYVYAYIIRDEAYREEHTALEDVLIETAIFAHCIRQKKKLHRGIDSSCWKIPQLPKSKQIDNSFNETRQRYFSGRTDEQLPKWMQELLQKELKERGSRHG